MFCSFWQSEPLCILLTYLFIYLECCSILLLFLNADKLTFFVGFPGYPAGYMNPPDQRRTPGGQYYAEYATINNQGGRSGPNRPPDIPQVSPAMQEYTDYQGTVTCLLLSCISVNFKCLFLPEGLK